MKLTAFAVENCLCKYYCDGFDYYEETIIVYN